MSKIPLQKFLKVLTSGNVPIAKAMTVSSKIYKRCNTVEQLSELDDFKLVSLGVDEKDLRKLVLSALKKAGYTTSNGKRSEPSTSSVPPSTVEIITTPVKRKRKRDEQDNEFLPRGPVDEASTYGSLEFNEVLDEEVLHKKSAVINRAPLMTVWATVVAERMGFRREEALSIASVYTEMNAISKGVTVGVFKAGTEKGLDAKKGGTQPYVDFIGRRVPLYQTQDGQWRALLHGTPAKPSAAFGYISRSLRQTTPFIVGALRLLADSFPSRDINNKAWSLYLNFRPEVTGWGERAEVTCSTILALKRPSEPSPPDPHSSEGVDSRSIAESSVMNKDEGDDEVEHEQPDSKRRKTSDVQQPPDKDPNLDTHEDCSCTTIR